MNQTTRSVPTPDIHDVLKARNLDPLVHETNTLRACLIFNQYMSFMSIEMSVLVNLQSNELIILEKILCCPIYGERLNPILRIG